MNATGSYVIWREKELVLDNDLVVPKGSKACSWVVDGCWRRRGCTETLDVIECCVRKEVVGRKTETRKRGTRRRGFKARLFAVTFQELVTFTTCYEAATPQSEVTFVAQRVTQEWRAQKLGWSQILDCWILRGFILLPEVLRLKVMRWFLGYLVNQLESLARDTWTWVALDYDIELQGTRGGAHGNEGDDSVVESS